MVKEAKVLRNTQIIDRFAPHNFLSVVRRDKTREILDIFIGCMEPDRDYILNLHQDEQVDDSRIVITNTVSFSERETCALIEDIEDGDLLHCSNCGGAAEKQSWAYWNFCPNCGAKAVKV